ncbi:MAG: hypothetical protein ACJ8DJ_16020 [Gemmatimonadales bacterium]
MRQHYLLHLSSVAALLAFAACSDQNQPSGPDVPADLTRVQGQPDDANALARAVPGFGGFFYDAQGRPTMYLTTPTARGAAERALAPYLQKHGVATGRIQTRPAAHTWDQLERWRGQVSPSALATRGAVYVDADEALNRVTVGAERGAVGQLRASLARLGLPADAMVVQEAQPITFAAGAPRPRPGTLSLQGRVRPIVGGVQINFPGFLCSLGFNVSGGFITASHCTNVQGGNNSTPYWQPLQSTDPVQIATEVADPNYVSGGTCPAGRRCRRSDSAKASYANDITFTLGGIARTDRVGRSLTITGQWSVTGEAVATVGQVVNKVGRTTGWSQGQVTNTCVDTNVSGSDITELCQNFVSATVGSGDSGSPVFAIGSGSNVSLVGILWGGSGSSSFVYSPMANIHNDLGSFAVR